MSRKNKTISAESERSIKRRAINKKGLREETMLAIYGIGCIVAALFFILAYFDTVAKDGSPSTYAGIAGTYAQHTIVYLFGVGYILLPLVLFMLSIAFFRSIKQRFSFLQLLGSVLFLASALGLIQTLFHEKSGGFIGSIISMPLVKIFDLYASVAFLCAIVIASTLVIFDTHLRIPQAIMFWKKEESQEDEDQDIALKEKKRIDAEKELLKNKKLTPIEDTSSQEISPTEDQKQVEKEVKKGFGFFKNSDEIIVAPSRKISTTAYNPPPLTLLEKDKGKPGTGDIRANANIIKRTLQNFGINVEMDEISIGPSVTRYALKPAEGMKLSRIVALQNDLALALAAHPLRIEAPIPGKSLVGIEIPNSTKTTVGLATLLAEDDYTNSEKPLLVSLGKGISGKSQFANLAKAPHLLIAGATGSGKSVTIHAILTSLLYRNSPDQLKFIMIDPKRVELTLYNNIPHLLTSVITDAKKAILALRWAGKEMDRRYDLLETKKVRDIESYHKNIVIPGLERAKKNQDLKRPTNEELPETMPYIVVVIDELADIMQAYPRELESGIVRLAQMSRAVGIHLILSTQRPSVNVITGLIKANVPSRIALQVTSQIDSRTILDSAGAEKLLGAGDMLFQSGEMSKPMRIQSAFISETELKKVVSHLIDNWKDELPTEIDLSPEAVADKNAVFSSSFDKDGDEDELYEDAKQTVIAIGKASTSLLQRKLSIGYARAARLIDMLEAKGVVGPSDGSKPREIRMKNDEPTP